MNSADKAVWILRIVLMGAVLGSFGLAFVPGFATGNPATVISTESSSSAQEIADPALVTIPSLNIQSDIVKVGVLKDGRMDTPKSAFDVGWFHKGPRPGENGHAVLAGHLDTAFRTPGVFWSLHTVKKGEEIQVKDAAGIVRVFRVTDVQTYKTAESPVKELFGDGGATPKLFLITCHGAWNTRIGDYESRLVVEAELVTQKDFSSLPPAV